jgi:hypothetical protein
MGAPTKGNVENIWITFRVSDTNRPHFCCTWTIHFVFVLRDSGLTTEKRVGFYLSASNRSEKLVRCDALQEPNDGDEDLDQEGECIPLRAKRT